MPKKRGMMSRARSLWSRASAEQKDDGIVQGEQARSAAIESLESQLASVSTALCSAEVREHAHLDKIDALTSQLKDPEERRSRFRTRQRMREIVAEHDRWVERMDAEELLQQLNGPSRRAPVATQLKKPTDFEHTADLRPSLEPNLSSARRRSRFRGRSAQRAQQLAAPCTLFASTSHAVRYRSSLSRRLESKFRSHARPLCIRSSLSKRLPHLELKDAAAAPARARAATAVSLGAAFRAERSQPAVKHTNKACASQVRPIEPLKPPRSSQKESASPPLNDLLPSPPSAGQQPRPRSHLAFLDPFESKHDRADGSPPAAVPLSEPIVTVQSRGTAPHTLQLASDTPLPPQPGMVPLAPGVTNAKSMSTAPSQVNAGPVLAPPRPQPQRRQDEHWAVAGRPRMRIKNPVSGRSPRDDSKGDEKTQQDQVDADYLHQRLREAQMKEIQLKISLISAGPESLPGEKRRIEEEFRSTERLIMSLKRSIHRLRTQRGRGQLDIGRSQAPSHDRTGVGLRQVSTNNDRTPPTAPRQRTRCRVDAAPNRSNTAHNAHDSASGIVSVERPATKPNDLSRHYGSRQRSAPVFFNDSIHEEENEASPRDRAEVQVLPARARADLTTDPSLILRIPTRGANANANKPVELFNSGGDQHVHVSNVDLTIDANEADWQRAYLRAFGPSSASGTRRLNCREPMTDDHSSGGRSGYGADRSHRAGVVQRQAGRLAARRGAVPDWGRGWTRGPAAYRRSPP